MQQEAHRIASPETIERGVARGKRLQAQALREAFTSLFRRAESKQPAVTGSGGARQDGFARA
ncbi:MAG: hypothetical protein QNJ67_18470 [Kiloniellales bacterium]|nr:hypothetical protein [Kiloniellales bacterium]